MTPAADLTRKFIFDDADIRGEIVHLDHSYREIAGVHQYPPGVRRLMGEFISAAVLLSTTIKFEGRLILQAQGGGEVPLLMAECSNDLEVRAIARGAQQATGEEFSRLLGHGQLAITIEPREGRRYQGIVPLEGENLSACIEDYFERSEQLPTRLWLASDGERAGGLLLQQLPAQVVEEPVRRLQQWEEACTLAATVDGREVLGTGQERLLARLFHESPVRLFEGEPVRFACSCSRERSHEALLALGEIELGRLLEEESPVVMDCEFCNARYEFTAEDFVGEIDIDDSPPVH